MVEGHLPIAKDFDPGPIATGRERSVSITVGVTTIGVVSPRGEDNVIIIRALSEQRATNSQPPTRVELHHHPTLHGQRNVGVHRYVARHHVHISRRPGGILRDAAADLDRGRGVVASVPPENRYLHDVYDVNVAIVINVVVGIIAPVPAFAAPFARHPHDVHDVYLAIFVEISKQHTRWRLLRQGRRSRNGSAG